MRIGIDGYNLAIPNGTGVATYGSSLAGVLKHNGHDLLAVFGIDPGRDPETREAIFFERFGSGETGVRKGRGVAGSVLSAPFGKNLINVSLTPHVDRRGFETRWPAFGELWTHPALFEAAAARFFAFRQFLTVRIPNPPEVMHWTYPVPLRMAGSRNIYTLHDLVPLKLPHTTLDNKSYYRKLIERIVRTADHVLTVSEASRTDIVDMFGADPDRVTNTYQSSPIHPAVAASCAEDDFTFAQRVFGLEPRGYYLFMGASDPKKNISRIIDAYLASGSQRPLVMVSSRDWGMAGANGGLGKDGTVYGRKVGQRIIQLQYLPRETLLRLIRAARAVLFPSLYEGFGLPALEAIQLGTPVISSETSSLPEVVGNGGLLVDPYSTNAIAQAIRELDGNEDLLSNLRAQGLVHARKFSDQAFADRMRAVYDRLGLPVSAAS